MKRLERPIDTENNGDDDFDYLFKVVLIGDTAVGKSAIVHRFKHNIFIDRNASTIGVDFLIKSLMIDGKKVKLQIWDTAGQERFRTITQSYYRSAHGVIIVYDLTKFETFKNVERWLKDSQRLCGSSSVVQMLVGNKKDLESQREVPENDAKQFAEFNSIHTNIETSAKDSTNVEEAFYAMATLLKESYEESKLMQEKGFEDKNIILESRTVRNWGCCS
eukprot:gene6022-6722_t